MTTRRREVLLGTAAAAAGVSSLPMPAIAQGTRKLKMVTDWSENSPGLQTSAERLGRSITAISEGRLKVTVYAVGSLVRAFETFDVVTSGAADMYPSSDYYFAAGKSPALYFFCAVPYGMTADELSPWIDFGGGQALWDEVDSQFNIKPLMAFNTGDQMGGWLNKEISRPKDYKGLRYRMPELGAEVLRRMGATVVTTPGGEIRNAIRSDRRRRVGWPLVGCRARSRQGGRLFLLPRLPRTRRSASTGLSGTASRLRNKH